MPFLSPPSAIGLCVSSLLIPHRLTPFVLHETGTSRSRGFHSLLENSTSGESRRVSCPVRGGCAAIRFHPIQESGLLRPRAPDAQAPEVGRSQESPAACHLGICHRQGSQYEAPPS